MSKDEIIQEMLDSGLKGRGGAGFPTGLKWNILLQKRVMKNMWSVMQMRVNLVHLRIVRF